MSDVHHTDVFPVRAEIAAHAHVDAGLYRTMVERAERAPDAFWAEQAKRIPWIKAPTTIKNTSFSGAVSIRWFEDGVLNASAVCLDQHLEARGDQVAIIWEGDDPERAKSITYRELHEQVCRLANGLRALGAKKGDRITIYLPMVIEAAVAMLACARIGAIHSVVFGGFSPDSLANRIQDCGSTLLITADEGRRGGRKRAHSKTNADKPRSKDCPGVETPSWWCAVTDAEVADAGRPRPPTTPTLLAAAVGKMPARADAAVRRTRCSSSIRRAAPASRRARCTPPADTSSGRAFTHEAGVRLSSRREVFWCTADVGWVTGHTYILYGPLANGATTLMFEGVPNYPDSEPVLAGGRQAPRSTSSTPRPPRSAALVREGEAPVRQKTSRAAACGILGSVGEPINPEAWLWYRPGDAASGRCPIVDTWWQTETGGILISPLPGCDHRAQAGLGDPAAARRPAGDSSTRRGHGFSKARPEGNLCLADSPGPARCAPCSATTSGSVQTYFSRLPGPATSPATGAGAMRGRLLLDHRPRRRRHQRLRPPHGHRRGGERAGHRTRRWSPRPPWSASRTTSRARASTPT